MKKMTKYADEFLQETGNRLALYQSAIHELRQEIRDKEKSILEYEKILTEIKLAIKFFKRFVEQSINNDEIRD